MGVRFQKKGRCNQKSMWWSMLDERSDRQRTMARNGPNILQGMAQQNNLIKKEFKLIILELNPLRAPRPMPTCN